MTRLLVLGSVAVTLSAQQPQPPYLFFRLIAPHGLMTPGSGRPTEVANNQRIALQICIRVRSVEDRFEQPEIQALNQHPDYFKNRPPANITLSVRRIREGGAEEVPVRVNSPGGGKDLTLHYVQADIDMLEEKEVRVKRVEQFVEWMAAQPGVSRSRLLEAPGGKSQMAAFFEERYINNPPGEYEFIARYAPTTPDNWRGSLVSAPFRIKVVDQGDFLDVMKARIGVRQPIVK